VLSKKFSPVVFAINIVVSVGDGLPLEDSLMKILFIYVCIQKGYFSDSGHMYVVLW